VVKGPLRPELAQAGLGGIISLLLSFLYAIAAVILFFIFVWGGYDILTSQGNEEKLSSGSQKISSGVIGFILLVLAFFLTRIVAYVFGLDTSFIF
jgi:TRAP-type C4-dicarboxylate transport system permease small subunit